MTTFTEAFIACVENKDINGLKEMTSRQTGPVELDFRAWHFNPKYTRYIIEQLAKVIEFANPEAKKISIFLGSNSLGDEGAKILSQSLKHSRCMIQLDLTKNPIADEGARYLAEGLRESSCPVQLRLMSNNISAPGLIDFINDGVLKANKGVTLDIGEDYVLELDEYFDLYNQIRNSSCPMGTRILGLGDDIVQACEYRDELLKQKRERRAVLGFFLCAEKVYHDPNSDNNRGMLHSNAAMFSPLLSGRSAAAGLTDQLKKDLLSNKK